MAAVATELAIVVFGNMAGHARGIVVLVQHKELAMLEGRRFPGTWRVALTAITNDFAVHGVVRWLVAGFALGAGFGA
jgi:hypothetical protein